MLDLNKWEKALKIRYSDEHIENMALQENPTLALLPKSDKFGGKSYQFDIISEDPQNGSATFSDGQGNDSTTELISFNLTRKNYYSFAFVDGETLEASQGDEDAMLEALETEIDGALNSAKNQLSFAIFRTKSGIIGKVKSIVGSVVELTEPSDIEGIRRGMLINASTTAGSGASKSLSLKVVSVDLEAGKFTLNSVVGLAVDDYVFRKGNYNQNISGFADWIPYVKPAAGDNFYGTDRSTLGIDAYGQRMDATAMALKDALPKAAALVSRRGGKVSHFIMNDNTYIDLVNSLADQVRYINVDIAGISFEGIKVATTKGSAVVLADKDCPADLVYGLTIKTWQLKTLGKFIRFINYANNKILTMTNKDAVEVRCGYRGNLLCKAPAWNIVLKVAPAVNP